MSIDLSFLRKPRSLVGLDIGSSAVKAIELKPQGKNGYRVTAFAVEPIPPDTIVDGAIIDAVAVADAIRRIFETKRFKSVEVVASLSGNAVIVKKIALPVMTPAELAESIQWEAEQYIPFDVQDVNIDYQVLDGGGAESGKQTMDVLLVAAKKDKIADYTGVITGRAIFLTMTALPESEATTSTLLNRLVSKMRRIASATATASMMAPSTMVSGGIGSTANAETR